VIRTLLFYLLIIWVAFKIWRMLTRPKGLGTSRPKSSPDAGRIDGGELVQDPHCGVYIPKDTAIRGPDGSRFCSQACLEAHQKKKA
jgi:uncharacterized protein